jgi:hypothetical protein
MSALAVAITNLSAGAAENGIFTEKFTSTNSDGIVKNWQFQCKTGALNQASCRQGTQRIILQEGSRAELKRKIKLPAGKILLFQVKVRSENDILVTVGKRRMAYSKPGQEQLIADLINTGASGKLEVKFALGGLPGKAEFEISDLSIRTAELPTVLDRKIFDKTQLTDGHKATAYIIYPSKKDKYFELASKVSEAVFKKSGVKLQVIPDIEATEKDVPKLKQKYADSNLIILGRLGINRALWPAYNRFLAAADGYYPGGSGYVIRTASNVMRNGCNHIVLGSSNEKGAVKAVDEFIKIINEQNAKKALVLPWLLKVELGGKCRRAFRKNAGLWATNPKAAGPHKLESGYGKVVRWYVNAMGYYWSGMDGYKKRSKKYLKEILDDFSYTHHYIIEFFVRTWDMLDDTGIYTASERKKADSLILKNFVEFLTGCDLIWMHAFNRPYSHVHVVNRHNIAPWMADMQMADFLNDYFKLSGDLKKIVDYRRSEKHEFMKWWVNNSFNLSLPRTDHGSHREEITASMFRYALEHEEYGFFTNGNAKKALSLWEMSPLRSKSFDDRLLAGMVASYYGDGKYYNLYRLLAECGDFFQDRYLCGVHRYRPGRELKKLPMDSLAGVKATPMQRHDEVFWKKLHFDTHRKPNFPVAEALEVATFRQGFGRNDDFLKIVGLGTDTGSIQEFFSHGKLLLLKSNSSIFGNGKDNYYDRNAVSIIRNDKWITDPKPFVGAARRNWIADFSNSGGVSMTIDPFMTASWQRDIVWLKPGLYVVRDVISALENGDYTIRVGWRPQGRPDWNGTSWTGKNGDVLFRITPLGKNFKTVENVDDYLSGKAEYPKFHFSSNCNLKKGQNATAYAVLEVVDKEQHFHDVKLTENGHAVTLKKKNNDYAVIFGTVKNDELNSNASVLIVNNDKIEIINGSKASISGQNVLDSKSNESKVISKKLDMPKILASLIPVTMKAAGGDSEQAIKIAGRNHAWQPEWKYDGIQLPAKLEYKIIGGGIVDFGKNIELAEIRAAHEGRFWTPTKIPADLRYAEDTGTGKAPGSKSSLWKKFNSKPTWRPGINRGNYGKAIPQEHSFQVMYPNVKVRYIKGSDLRQLTFYQADKKCSRSPYRLEITQAKTGAPPVILLAPEPWPKFIRSRKKDDFIIAVLNTNGDEKFRYQTPNTLQSVRVLDQKKSGHNKVFVVTEDAKIRIFNLDGKLVETVDMYEMHRRFHQQEGKPNTRHPAGGFTMPYDIGLWRSDSTGKSKMVVSRYHSYSFLDRQLKFEGVRGNGDYVVPVLLEHGVDYDNDGLDEMYGLGKFKLIKFYGKKDRRITEPGGSMYFPQVYYTKFISQPVSESSGVDGEKPLIFKTIPVTGEKPVIIAARPSYLAVFDGVKQRWCFEWKPQTSISAVDVIKTGKYNYVLASTEDNMLWELKFNNNFTKLKSFKNWNIPCDVTRIRVCPQNNRSAVISTNKGIFIFKDGRMNKLADGSWQDAVMHPDGSKITAVDKSGLVKTLASKK